MLYKIDREFVVFIAIIALCVVFFFSIHGDFIVGLDNPAYTEPAINFLIGKGFTSTSWYAQGNKSFWAGNVPLHQFILIPWLKFTGISFVSVITLNYIFVLSSAALIWTALRKSCLIATPQWRLACIFCLLSTSTTYSLLTEGRYESLGLAICGAGAVFFTTKRPFVRRLGLFVTAALLPWTHLAITVFAALTIILLLLFYGKLYWRECLVFAFGGCFGALALVVFYFYMGVLNAFFLSIAPHSQVITHNQPISKAPQFGGYWKPELDYILVAVGVAGFAVLCFIRGMAIRFPLFIIANMLFILVAIAKLGKLSPYYGWMLLFSPAVFLFAALSKVPLPKKISVAVCCGFALIGVMLPGSLFRKTIKSRILFAKQGSITENINKFALSVTSQDDTAWVNPIFYYSLKQHVKVIITEPAGFGYYNWFPVIRYPGEEDDMKAVTVCLWRDTDISRQHLSWLPGEWNPTGEVFTLNNLSYYVYRRDHTHE